MDMEKMAKELATMVKGFVEKECAPLRDEVASLKKQLSEMEPAKDGKDGRDGIDGKDGAPGTNGVDGTNGRDGVDGKDGRDGKDIAPDEIKSLIAELLPDALTGIEKTLTAAVETLLKDMPQPKDGAPGRDGVDGQDGRDALQLHILPDIDESKSYSRGTYATHKGGLWHAHSKTHGMRGWECVVDGLASIEVLTYDNDDRTIGLVMNRSSGDTFLKNLTLPIMIYRGIYSADQGYKKDDSATYAGSLWVAREDTTDVPGTSEAWKLCAKKGRDAKPIVKVGK